MRQQQKFRGWIDNTWSKCRYSEQRAISISINYSSDSFHERFREVIKYVVRWYMMDRFSIPDLWAVSGVSLLSKREKQSVVNTHESESGVMAWGESQEDTFITIEMANHQGYLSPYMTNSLAIRQEIQRFESVHPSIYAIYDLIELVPDPLLAQQIREHVVCIEGRIRIEILHICVAKMASEERYWSFLGDNLSERFLPPWVLGI